MRKKHNYELRGITKEQYNAWNGNVREDLQMKYDEYFNIVRAHIQLTWLQMLIMRIQILRSNVKENLNLELVRSF